MSGEKAPSKAGTKPARRWPRRLLTIGGLFLALIVLLGLFAPMLLGGFVGGYVERDFAQRYEGTVELPAVSLAWRSRQTVEGVRLYDPKGGEVAHASLSLPSLLDVVAAARAYAGDERCELGRIEIDFEAQVVMGVDGVSNLERALAPREEPPAPPPATAAPPAPPAPSPTTAPPPPPPPPAEPAEDDSVLQLYERLGLELVLRAKSVHYRDERAGAAAPPIALSHLQGALSLQPGRPLEFALQGVHELGAGESGKAGPLAVSFSASEPSSTSSGLDFGAIGMTLDIEHLPFDVLAERFGKPELAQQLEELLGERISLRADVAGAGALERKTFHIGLEAGRVKADARGRFADGRVESPPDAPMIELAVTLPRGLLEGLAAPYLPEGGALDTSTEGAQLTLSLAELSLPLGSEDMLGETRARFALSVGPLAYTDAGERFELQRVELGAAIAPGEGPSLELSGDLDETGASRLAARVGLPDGWAAIASEGRYADLAVDLQLSAQGFPTRILDAHAHQDGLLSDVLGPQLELTLGAQGLSKDGGHVDARFDSALGFIDWKATIQGGALRAVRPDDRLTAKARLGPLLSERIIGPLLPILVDVRKPSGADPVELNVSDFVLPIDGDMSSLNAKVGISLGSISYRLLPGLAEQLPTEKLSAQRTLELPAYVVRIGDGVARYEDLPLSIDGRRFDWKGSFDLEERRFDLTTDLPLSKIGGDVGKLIDPVRAALSPDTAVPLRLGGTLKSPQLSIRSGFLEQAAKDAAQNVLQKELEKGLGGDLQKKLKDLLGRDGE